MTLNLFIKKLIQLMEQNNASEFSVKVPYRYDMDVQGTKFQNIDSIDITNELFCINTEDKALYILDVDDSTACMQQY